MKQLLSITTLFVAMMLLNSGATTSESAKASNVSHSPTALLSSAKAEQEICETVRELAIHSWLTPDATEDRQLLSNDFKGAQKGAPIIKSDIDNDVKGNIGGAAQIQPPSIEIALVANAQAGTVALVDVASRSVLGTIDVNPARVKSEGPGAPNYADHLDPWAHRDRAVVNRRWPQVHHRSTNTGIASRGVQGAAVIGMAVAEHEHDR